ncbi:MAG: translation initiation factor IF-2 [Oceanipulchritudo sp.]
MSVRIYQLSKEIEMENAELIALLKERGYEVKSASSTIDNISAESLREEFGPKAEREEEPPAPEEPQAEPVAEEEKRASLPKGAIVRSKAEIEEERRQREIEEEEKRKAEVVPPKPPPPPPGKTPPPLPGIPAITRRQPPVPGSREPRERATSPGTPKVPVLRTDMPPEAPKEAPVEEKPAAPAPKPSPLKGPPPIKPPVSKGPPSISPPKAPPPEPEPEVEEAPSPEAGEAEAPGEEETGGLKPLQVRSPIVVRDFARQIGRKPFQLISELMEMSIFASMNSSIEEDVAERLARTHGYALEVRHRGAGAAVAQAETVKEEKKPAPRELVRRPPVICILGHVDHGKTTLLDTIRKANVVSTEAGGITQHIGAYQINYNDKLITFIDTPGHAAFSSMRARGARTTDIAVLVVAADDGFMPQTDEALGHARVAKVPVVVAINKIDRPGANLDKVMRQMQERELTPEDWGGETLSAKVSALKGEGIDDLLEAILLQSEVTETIVADPKGPLEGVIVEAQKELGRGSTASAIIQQGTLKPGAALVSGEYYCRVRQIIDDSGKQIKQAGPSTPVKIIGWSGPPDAGDTFQAVKNEREAKKIAEANELKRRKLEASEQQEPGGSSVEDLFAAIEKTQKKTFSVLVKADVYGTAEALATSLQAIKSDKIDLEVVDMRVGDVTRNDIIMSSAAGASIVAFNVGLENGVTSVAKHHGIKVFQHNIIYELIDQVKDAMADLLEPERRENKIGVAEVRQVFPVGKGQVAGCMVTEGRIQRDALARLMRKGELVRESKISTLKRFKEDVNEVRAGYECGLQLEGHSNYEERDTVEVFEILKIKPDL